MQIWEVVHHERAELIRDLADLAPGAWDTPSLCDGWTVHDVLAHLIHDAKATKVGFFADLILAGFNFDRANQRGVKRERQDSPPATLAAFEHVRNRTSSAPAPLASRFVEIIVHGEDIRRPLGIRHTYPMEAITAALDYQLATSDSMGGSKNRAAGLRLIATDADWTEGSGAVVRGPALELLLALTGRRSGAETLTGDGVDTLKTRIQN